MKNCFILLSVLLSLDVFSQLTADAGKDSTICVSWTGLNAYVLGGNPTVKGGIAPYTFTWECSYLYSVGTFSTLLTGSDFLDDTTSANPSLINYVSDPITFYLTVEDATGAIATDSITISFSIFALHLGEVYPSLIAGDSLLFQFGSNVLGGTNPLQYLWRPNHGLTDSTSATGFWIKPTTSTSYYVTVSDSVGCVVSGTPFVHVSVGTANLPEISKEHSHTLLVYPNPSNGKLLIRPSAEVYDKLMIYDETGQLQLVFHDLKQEIIDISQLPEGGYTLVFSNHEDAVLQKIVKTN